MLATCPLGEARRGRIDLSANTLAVLATPPQVRAGRGPDRLPVLHDTVGGCRCLSNLVKNSFKPALARAGLPSMGLCTLRHTRATLGSGLICVVQA